MLADFNEGGLDGPEAYQALLSFYRQSGRNKLQAQNELNETLEDLGHDGILTTHDNTVNIDGTDRMANTETYEGSSISYQGVVVFDPEGGDRGASFVSGAGGLCPVAGGGAGAGG